MTSAVLEAGGRADAAWPQLPWLALTSPLRAWRALERNPRWWPGVAAQTLLLVLAGWVAAPAYSELDRVLTGVNASPLQAGKLLGIALSVVAAVLCANLIVAAVLWGLLRAAGLVLGFQWALAYTSVVLLPLALGQALGKLTFALAMPLTHSPAEVLAWHVRPFSLGMASFLPQPPPVLSLQWAIYSCFDAFGLWALLLAVSGLRPLLKARREQLPWLILALVLVFAAGILGVWQAGQGWLSALG